MAECQEKHSHKYTYDNTLYEGKRQKIDITCPKHGDFTIRAGHHLEGQGCPACAKIAYSQSFSHREAEFIDKARAAHGGRYSYDNLNYLNLEHKVNITCHLHGDFLTDGRGHIQGKGCPLCAKSGYRRNRSGFLYVLHSDDGMTKVGITNVNVERRVKQINEAGHSFKAVAKFWFEDGNIPAELERKLLAELRVHHRQPSDRFPGYTECFYGVDLEQFLTSLSLRIP